MIIGFSGLGSEIIDPKSWDYNHSPNHCVWPTSAAYMKVGG